MNVVHVVRGAAKGALVAWTSANSRRLLVRLLRDEAGSLPRAFRVPNAGPGRCRRPWHGGRSVALHPAGPTGRGQFGGGQRGKGLFLMPTAANIQTQAEAITASYGFVNGSKWRHVVTVNQPPTSGNYTANGSGRNRSHRHAVGKTHSSRAFGFRSHSTSRPVRRRDRPRTPHGVLALGPSTPGSRHRRSFSLPLT